ncbi:PREDICTED: uncharacterized protein LOC105556498 [Vollenhovia emeryi]|uniref:uncharacterized protein LOC105556498 n=1 Tax=Vollenhovia emeryi TaxID=411798 RepID=UPI0005F3DDC8|nr:PREDICTED: uncharacterized protein LOC105556498 [Vollenhovia emeryi]
MTPVLMNVDQIITEQNIDVTQVNIQEESKLFIHNKIATRNTQERGTQTISQSSLTVCKGTAVSPRRIYNSPEKVKLREELNRTKKHYQSKIKALKQRTRRMERKIANMAKVFQHLKEKNFLQEEQFYNLKDMV